MGTGMGTTTGMHHTRVGAEADALYHEGKGHMPGTTEHAYREGEMGTHTGTHGATGGGVMGEELTSTCSKLILVLLAAIGGARCYSTPFM